MRAFFLRLPLVFAMGFIASGALFADELLPEGGFETPTIGNRTTIQKGGDPSNNGQGPGWSSINITQATTGGQISGGMTGDVAHGGLQCIYVDFDKVNMPGRGLSVTTMPIPIIPMANYKIGIWSHIDKKKPITGERDLFVKVQIDFLKKDSDTPAGDPIFFNKPLTVPPGGKPLQMVDGWIDFSQNLTAPDDAAFVMVTWKWESGNEEGDVSGVIFADDASITGTPGNSNPDAAASPGEMNSTDPATSGTSTSNLPPRMDTVSPTPKPASAD